MLGPQTWQGHKYTGKTIFEGAPYGEEILGFMPEEEDYQFPNIGEDEVSNPVKDGDFVRIPQQPWMFYLPRICNHCTYPACLAACPRKAIYKRKEDGIVLIDQKRFRGYRECIQACPYKKPFFRAYTGKAEKCIACYSAVEQGKQTQCVVTCIGRIRMLGFVSRWNEPKEDNPIDYLVHIKKIALPLYPHFGLEPNVYYIPPIHVPEEFNRQLFGPGAKNAVELYKKGHEDKKLVGLLMLFGATEKIVSSFKVEGGIDDGYCFGYDDKGTELVKVPLKEPTIVRKEYDEQRDVYRVSVT